MLSENTQQTVIAAKVSAELHHVQEITRSLSISSKNLRVLAKRIGQNAAGLAVLATFYDECSRETISIADYVTKMTVNTASQAVKEWRISLYEQKLEDAIKNIKPEQIPEIVKHHIADKPKREQENMEHINRFNRELHDLLIEMQKNIRSIAVIAVNSKIEAPRTGEHSPILLDMAESVEVMIRKILKHIDTSLKYITSTNSKAYR